MIHKYDRDHINPTNITKLEQRVIPNPKFTEKDAYGGSKASGYLYGWVKCMYDYYKVYTETRPLRE